MPNNFFTPTFELQFVDSSGDPLVDGGLYIYQPGTTTWKVAWTDNSKSVPYLPFGPPPGYTPIDLGSDGKIPLYLEGSYHIVLVDSGDNTILDIDDVDFNNTAFRNHIADTSTSVPRSLQAKLEDTISVMDFGAVPDGSTDNTDQFQDAIDYLEERGGGTLFIPRGVFNFADEDNLVIAFSNITVLFGGCKLLKAGSGNLFTVEGTSSKPVVSNIHFRGNGVITTPDTPRESLSTAIYLGTGTYSLENIRIDGLVIDGMGQAGIATKPGSSNGSVNGLTIANISVLNNGVLSAAIPGWSCAILLQPHGGANNTNLFISNCVCQQDNTLADSIALLAYDFETVMINNCSFEGGVASVVAVGYHCQTVNCSNVFITSDITATSGSSTLRIGGGTNSFFSFDNIQILDTTASSTDRLGIRFSLDSDSAKGSLSNIYLQLPIKHSNSTGSDAMKDWKLSNIRFEIGSNYTEAKIIDLGVNTQDCILENITGDREVYVKGDNNILSDINVTGADTFGITIEGDDNKAINANVSIIVGAASQVGVSLTGDRNKVIGGSFNLTGADNSMKVVSGTANEIIKPTFMNLPVLEGGSGTLYDYPRVTENTSADTTVYLVQYVDGSTVIFENKISSIIRTVNLPEDNLINGQQFKVVLSGDDLGSVSINYDSNLVVSLPTPGDWADVQYDGTKWICTAKGETT